MRISGILLHPTSLPGSYGIGDLGERAFRFADFLADAGIGLWQVLPLGPPAEGDSPYKCLSSMAGNPLLISLDMIREEDLLTGRDLEGAPAFPSSFVDFEPVGRFKRKLLRKAARAFFERRPQPAWSEFQVFCERQDAWLDEFARFAALRDENRGALWTEWPRDSQPQPDLVLEHKFLQFEFFRQWERLKSHCGKLGIRIMGDLPIFVAHDSADVWADPELFHLDKDGYPQTVAGVPPDYFSASGQKWGNPLYRWDVMEENGYRWWVQRIKVMLEMFDLIRIDHFRGFEKYYEIPCDAPGAIGGRWVEGPGDRIFRTLEQAFGRLPLVAEDLGLITPEVLALRDRWGFPGMRVLQFAFGDESPLDPFKPYNFIPHCVVYTGTHDNDTTLGWFRRTGGDTLADEQADFERKFALRYFNSDGSEIHWDFIRGAISSVADTAIFPLQDVLGLGSEARMNMPARAEGNWRWRYEEDQLTTEHAGRLYELNRTYGRLPCRKPEK